MDGRVYLKGEMLTVEVSVGVFKEGVAECLEIKASSETKVYRLFKKCLNIQHYTQSNS